MLIDQSDPDKEVSFESRGEPPLNSAIDRLPVAIREGQAGTTCRAHAHRLNAVPLGVSTQIGRRWRFGRDLYRHGQARPGEFGPVKWISTAAVMPPMSPLRSTFISIIGSTGA